MGALLLICLFIGVNAKWMVSLNEQPAVEYKSAERDDDSLLFPLGSIVPQTGPTNEGTISWARGTSFTEVPNLSIGLARMMGPPGNIRVSHWHPSVSELSMLTAGRCRVTVMFNTRMETFVLEVGDVFWAPAGTYHYFEKINDGEFTLIAAFDTAKLVTLDVTQPFGVMKALALDEVANSLGVSEEEADKLFGYPIGASREVFDLPQPDYKYDGSSNTPGPHCFKIQADPISIGEGATMRWITAPSFPQLTTMSMGVLELAPGAARKIQYSVNSHEFAIVLEGSLDVVVAGPGTGEKHVNVKDLDLVWTPLTWMNVLRNNGNSTARVLLVWTVPSPGFTALAQTFFADPHEVLGTLYRVPTSTFDSWNLDGTTPNPPGINLFGCPNTKACLTRSLKRHAGRRNRLRHQHK